MGASLLLKGLASQVTCSRNGLGLGRQVILLKSDLQACFSLSWGFCRWEVALTNEL